MIAKKYSYLLILVYLFGVTQPVIPLVNYAVNYDYIINNECIEKEAIENLCMGNCYLTDKIIEKIKEQTNSNKENRVINSEVNFLFIHIANQLDLTSKLVSSNSIYISFQSIIKDYTQKPIIPPPNFI